ncbi:MAG TPA: hypothetical protein VE467_18995, partial [Chryseolinea sp.]|nr:hypothetical protein [Chryseolinea sp.]
MQILKRALLLIFITAGISFPAASQLFNQNEPVINGQRPTPLITEKNTAITIAFENLRVNDPDFLVPPYPQGYTLNVFPGSNYTLSSTTVTPGTNFVGTLTVKVQVNDGKFDSNVFDLKIDVTNIKPVITKHQAISLKEGSSVTLLLSNFEVEDDDNQYPDDFSLTVHGGNNYTVTGPTIIPAPGFSGELNVPVSVNDGHVDSDQFEMTVEVKANIVPVIKGQAPLSTNQGKKITMELGRLTVDDTDNTYPDDFTLKVFAGVNYTLEGTTIIPNGNFTGTLKVAV